MKIVHNSFTRAFLLKKGVVIHYLSGRFTAVKDDIVPMGESHRFTLHGILPNAQGCADDIHGADIHICQGHMSDSSVYNEKHVVVALNGCLVIGKSVIRPMLMSGEFDDPVYLEWDIVCREMIVNQEWQPQ